ncbi:hypothetical protein [Pedobacter psychroterrae]|uniref:Uncharacterized protein n=1 Tax=Pedobacter psychroterrae TaxID=2530453 RepID=A0A4R0NKU7_9SPHI|nr:hypothetical protein [Pedobacter psychroterrae]TCD01216.1 hypothetical protein EZ437_10685 [Pedobacter psychroterrae]
MKQKILWIVASALSCVTWFIHIRYYSNDFSNLEKQIISLADSWAMWILIGACAFPLAFASALFLPKQLSYANRFNKVLPVIIIAIEIIFIYGLGSLAYGVRHGYSQ